MVVIFTMPKALVIDPIEIRRTDVLRAPEIPINAYVSDPPAEAAKYGTESLVRIYRDMVYIREFEGMLDRIKKEGVYNGIEYNHKGPAHLSIGQESAAVGQAYHLGPEDFIFGSHRSHGEIIAKSLSAIAKMSAKSLAAWLALTKAWVARCMPFSRLLV
jgi:2-oxoisovalerate dehydrogenase E1 component